jgi:hypothetical protein
MVKRFMILLMSLAYSLLLAHSVVPHHHQHEAAKIHPHTHDAHSHGHHHDDDNDEKTLSHFFADVLHHPAGSILIRGQASGDDIAKVNGTAPYSLLVPELVSLPEFKPPDSFDYRSVNYSLDLFSTSLLRAPPAI